MIPTPKGAIVRRDELETITRALDQAIESLDSLIDCHSLPKGSPEHYTASEAAQLKVWRDDRKAFAKLKDQVYRCQMKAVKS